MENNNISVNRKNDTNKTLRKILFPMGIATASIFFIWMILHATGVALKNNIEVTADLIDAARYIAIAALFVSLVVCGLLITHAVLQLVQVRKSNMKHELPSGIINALVGLLIFIFFMILVVKVFDEEKWSYFEPWLYLDQPFAYGLNTFEIFAMMGIMFALLMYTSLFAFIFNKKDNKVDDTNYKMLRTFGISLFVLSIVAFVVAILGSITGFKNASEVFDKDYDKYLNNFRTYWLAGAMAIKYALGIVGSIALFTLSIIPIAICANNSKDERTKEIILWSILGGVALILFAIAASMMKINKATYEGEKYVELVTSKWYLKTPTCSTFALIAAAGGLVCGIIPFVRSRKLVYRPTKTEKAIQA